MEYSVVIVVPTITAPSARPPHYGRVGRRDAVGVDLGSPDAVQAGHVDGVLHRDRDAVHRPDGVGRQVDGKAPTTLARRLQRDRLTARIELITEKMIAWLARRDAVLRGLASLGTAIQVAVSSAIAELQPAIRTAIRRTRHTPEADEARRPDESVVSARAK